MSEERVKKKRGRSKSSVGREDRIEFIKQKSLELFIRKGIEGTSVRDICTATGIEAPTLYYYFESKNGLVMALVESLYNEYAVHFSRMKLLERLENPQEKLRLNLLDILVYHRENIDKLKFYYYITSFQMGELQEEVDGYVEKIREMMIEAPRKYYDEMEAEGRLLVDKERSLNEYMRLMKHYCFEMVSENTHPSVRQFMEEWKIFSDMEYKEP